MATLVKTWGEAAGMAYFRSLAEMKPDVRKGHVLLAELIAAGEIPVGLTVYNSNAESLGAAARRSTGCRSSRWSGGRRASRWRATRRIPTPRCSSSISCSRPKSRSCSTRWGGAGSTKVGTDLNRFPYTMVDQ